MNTHQYNVSVTWNEGRLGTLSSTELNDDISVATPPEFKGGIPNIWSPEHLFTASVLSCFMTTFLAIAEASKLEFESFDCRAEGILDRPEKKYLMTEIKLLPTLVIKDASKVERAERILQKAEKSCLITNSITTTVHLDTTITIQP